MKFKILFILIAFILFSCGNKSSKISPSQNLTVKDSIKQYHSLVNKAELEICDSNYSDALIHYDSAFTLNDEPFSKDIYNASLVSIYSGNYNKAIQFCEKLIELGCKLNFFDQIPFNKLKKDKVKWTKLKDKYKELRNKYKSHNNFDLKNNIENLFLHDQSNFCGMPIEGVGNLVPEDSVYVELKNLLLKFGYPNNKLIGIPLKKDTILSISPIDIIIRHYYQDNYYDLSQFLLNEIYAGKVLPSIFISWDEFKYEPYSHYGSCLLNKFSDNYYILNDSIEENKQVIQNWNKNRKKVFMDSYDNQLKKLIFSIKYPERKFKFIKYSICIHHIKETEKQASFLVNYKKINLDDY